MAKTTDPELSPGMLYPHVRLAGAILLQAVTAAAAGDPEARAWLLEDDAMLYAEVASLDPVPVRSWASKGCPMRAAIRRNLEKGQKNV